MRLGYHPAGARIDSLEMRGLTKTSCRLWPNIRRRRNGKHLRVRVQSILVPGIEFSSLVDTALSLTVMQGSTQHRAEILPIRTRIK